MQNNQSKPANFKKDMQKKCDVSRFFACLKEMRYSIIEIR
jgi:hypothetical protein